MALGIRTHSAQRTLTMKLTCIPRCTPQARPETNVKWNEPRRNHAAPDEEHHTAAIKQYGKSLLFYQDKGLAEAAECVGALYHRLSALAEDHIAKSSGIGHVNPVARRGTTVRTKTVVWPTREEVKTGSERSSSCGNQGCTASTAKHRLERPKKSMNRDCAHWRSKLSQIKFGK